MARGVAFVGLPPDEQRRVGAAIQIMSRHKLLRTPWCMCAVREADLVIVAHNSPTLRLVLESAVQQTGPITAVMAGAADAIPAGCERLLRPLRLEDLRGLLLAVEERMLRRIAGPKTAARARRTTGGTIRALHAPVSLLELATTLREANEARSGGSAWIVRGIGPGPLYVVPGDATFRFEGSLSTLRNLPRGSSLTITRIPEQDLPCGGGAGKPLIMLQWLVGMLLGQKSLLPWVDPEAAYSLQHWPDVTLLKHKLNHQRIAVLLRQRASVIPEIVRLAQVDEQAVNEFLNAASLTGRLVAANAPPIRAARLPNVGSAVLQRLRKALRIGIDR